MFNAQHSLTSPPARDVVTGDLSTLDEWTSVLALATKWEFDAHRALAIDRIVLARTYDIPNWLDEEYYRLCVREEALTLEEGRRLGMEDVILLAELRQRVRAHAWGYTMPLHETSVRHTNRARLATR